ncbi:MAG: FAD-dependent oxidoreductase, partial [Rickettsiales bacterium]
MGAAFAALPRNPDIVIVGAGMAGLAAAQALRRAGFGIAVLEARSRIGGRAYTERDSFGVPFDHGCAWLNGTARNPLVKLTGDLGFRVLPDNGPIRMFGAGDGAGSAATDRFQVAIGNLQAAIDEAGAAGRDVSFAKIYRPQDAWERLALLLTSTTSYGVEPTDVSVVDSYNRAAIEKRVLVPRGLGSAVTAYGMGMPVALGRPVERIAWSGSDVEVGTPAGTLRAKAALITVSTGVLSSGAIRFDPVL